MELFFAGSLLVCLIAVLLRYSRPSLLSPVYALLIAYILVFGAGGLLYDPAYGGGSARFNSSPEELFALSIQICLVLCAFIAGALFSNIVSKTPLPRRTNLLRPRRLTKVQIAGGLYFSLISLALLVVGDGISDIWSRSEYLPEYNHTLKSIGTALWPVSILTCGAISTTKRFSYKFAATAVSVASLLIALALNTRIFCFVPVLFFAGSFIVNPKRLALKAALMVSLLISPFLIVIPVTGRQLPQQGLIEIPELVLALSEVDLNQSLHETVNNVFLSEPLTAASTHSSVPDAIEYVAICVNPLPGFMTTWDSAQIRVNAATPFNAIGDLLRAGTTVACLYFAIVGFFFQQLDARIRSASKPSVEKLTLMALSYLFIVLSMQYPLRNATRLIYYSLTVLAVGKIVSLMLPNTFARRNRRQIISLANPDGTPLCSQ